MNASDLTFCSAKFNYAKFDSKRKKMLSLKAKNTCLTHARFFDLVVMSEKRSFLSNKL